MWGNLDNQMKHLSDWNFGVIMRQLLHGIVERIGVREIFDRANLPKCAGDVIIRKGILEL